jgi:GMP synthase (glutamine-hydrolysing)
MPMKDKGPMKQVAVLKTGDSHPKLVAQIGDFESWIIKGLGLPDEKVMVVDVRRTPELPRSHILAGVVITGSHAMVTHQEDWSRRTAAWLPGIVSKKIPVLGICYGHQLLAHALGGRVADNPRGMEIGTVSVDLTGDGRKDSLLGQLINPLELHVCHTQTVMELPPRAHRLASSNRDSHQAFRVGPSAWGVQFHPEFNSQSVAFYIQKYRQELTRQGNDVDQLLSRVRETPWGTRILGRFAAMTQS